MDQLGTPHARPKSEACIVSPSLPGVSLGLGARIRPASFSAGGLYVADPTAYTVWTVEEGAVLAPDPARPLPSDTRVPATGSGEGPTRAAAPPNPH